MSNIVCQSMCKNVTKLYSRWLPYCIGFFLVLHAGGAAAENSWENWQERSGPISVVNQSPIQLLFLQPIPDRADTLPKGHWSIRFNTTITNTLFDQESENFAATIDMEAIRTSLELNYGLTPRLELGLSLPLADYHSGFMDKPILDVERTFGKARGLREQEEANRFTYAVKKNGQVFISSSENSVGIGDFALRIKGKIREEGKFLPALSTRAAIKIPTGNDNRAFGSGEIDWGAGLLLQKNIRKMSIYLNADVTLPGDAYEEVVGSLDEFYTFMLGTEYRFTPNFSALAQINWISRPFEHTGLSMLDRRIIDLVIGLSYHLKNGLFIQAGGVEDCFDSLDAAADFTFFFNAGVNF